MNVQPKTKEEAVPGATPLSQDFRATIKQMMQQRPLVRGK